jgi:hypothetical protein
MASTTDTWGEAWEPFFLSHPLPLEEEEAFRYYLETHAVPDGTAIQDLLAHYDQFLLGWEPGQRRRGNAHESRE